MEFIFTLEDKIAKGSRWIKILWCIILAFFILMIVSAMLRPEILQNLYALWKNIGIPVLSAWILIELSLTIKKTNWILSKIDKNLASNKSDDEKTR
jgi:hypothetical protein